MKRKHIFFVLIAFGTAFLALQSGMTLLTALSPVKLRVAYQALRLFPIAGILGIMVPVIESRKYSLPYDRPSTPTRIKIGIALSIAAVALEIAFFSSWHVILIQNQDDLIRIKHILTTLPISIAVSLLFYFIIPQAIDGTIKQRLAAWILMAIIPGAAFGLTMFAETGFHRVDVLAVMTLVGFLAAASNILTGKFFLTFITIFLTVYANSLAELRYVNYSWPVAIIGCLFCLIILVASFTVRIKPAAA
jgi:hypothetical protein